MKKTKGLLLVILMTIFLTNLFGQDCVSCVENTTGVGKYANAMGRNNVATGYYSSAMGRYNQATGNASMALGFTNLSIGEYSTTIGSYLKSVGNNSFVIGSGLENLPLTNNIANSIMFGGVSNLPTLIVTGSSGMGTTGMIGIGNTGFPLYKLHLRADDGEAAAVFIQPFNWARGDEASLALGDDLNGISAVYEKGLFFKTQSFYNFNDGYIRIGLEARPGSVLVCADDKGTARWVQIEPPTPSPWLSTESGDIYFDKGKVGIGTINTTPYALAVKGYIITDEVMVKHYDMWPDFVFKPGFSLKPLAELEQYIRENEHLPDVPSANEVKENGYAIGDMNALLLQKIEELTLYIIDQEKRLQTQQQQMDLQQAEFESLKNVIEQQHINKD